VGQNIAKKWEQQSCNWCLLNLLEGCPKDRQRQPGVMRIGKIIGAFPGVALNNWQNFHGFTDG
jgi:hypothetical protein